MLSINNKRRKIMAKKKNLLGTVLEFIAFALAVVAIVMFFVPTIKTKNEDVDVSFAPYELCFVSAEKAEEKLEDAKSVKAIAHYTKLTALKESDETSGKLALAGWMQFATMLAGVVTVVAFLLSLAKKKSSNLALFATILMFVTSLVALIAVGAFMNAPYLMGEAGDIYKFGVGVILSFVASTLACASLVTKKVMKK